MDPSPSEEKHFATEAGFQPIEVFSDSNDKCKEITTEDTTLVSSTQPETIQQKIERLDTEPPTGKISAEHSPPKPSQISQQGELKDTDTRKQPMSSSVTHHSPKQKSSKVERPPTPVPNRKRPKVWGITQQHYRPPPLLWISMKPTPALVE